MSFFPPTVFPSRSARRFRIASGTCPCLLADFFLRRVAILDPLARSSAMAIACFRGRPASSSRRMFSEITRREDPFRSGILLALFHWGNSDFRVACLHELPKAEELFRRRNPDFVMVRESTPRTVRFDQVGSHESSLRRAFMWRSRFYRSSLRARTRAPGHMRRYRSRSVPRE